MSDALVFQSDFGLVALDKVAYIRFASVYKKFESLEQFINEIKYCEKEGN